MKKADLLSFIIPYCRRGIFNYYQKTQNERVSGGFCEYGVSIASNLRAIPDSVSFEEATFTEPNDILCYILVYDIPH